MSPRSRANRKHRRPTFRASGRRRKPGDAHTIPSFCAANHISEAFYFQLKRAGKGPREIQLNKRIIITPEAEQDWRREREAETAAANATKAAAEAAA
jgi:hypothetical protein